MPGVPIEMYAMVDRLDAKLPTLLPALKVPTVEEVHFAGIGESHAQDMLGDLLQGSERLTVGITAHEVGHITVRVVGRKVDGTASGGPSEARAQSVDFTRAGCPRECGKRIV